MRITVIIFLLVALLGLVVTADCRWGFIPLPLRGPEAGLIVGALAFFVGLIASLLAVVVAFVALRRSHAKGSGLILGLSCLLLVSFAIVFIA